MVLKESTGISRPSSPLNDVLKNRINSQNNFKKMNIEANALGPLAVLKDQSFSIHSQEYQAQALKRDYKTILPHHPGQDKLVPGIQGALG